MEDDVQHVEANRIQASSQEVVQSKRETRKYVQLKINIDTKMIKKFSVSLSGHYLHWPHQILVTYFTSYRIQSSMETQYRLNNLI